MTPQEEKMMKELMDCVEDDEFSLRDHNEKASYCVGILRAVLCMLDNGLPQEQTARQIRKALEKRGIDLEEL